MRLRILVPVILVVGALGLLGTMLALVVLRAAEASS